MMRVKIPFVGPSNKARSINADAQRSLNCYVEMDNASPRAPLRLLGTPGLRKVATLVTGPVRGMIAEGGYVWAVAGGTVYRVSPAYVVTTVGTIGTTTGAVGMASNGSEIIIVDGSAGYLLTVATATMAAISDADFPNGVRQAAYQDGYFVVTGDGTQSFYISGLLNGGAWDGLDFASAEGSPDNTVGVISDHRELWLFGANSAEVWVNTGNNDFPFERSGNTFIEHGCASAGSIAKLDNTVFWLGADDRGTGMVWRADGYTPLRISTHALELALSGYTLTDAQAFAYQQEGHGFYVLHFPTDGKTWVYDAATQQWGERAYRDALTGELARWRANCHAMLGGLHLVGDCVDGRLYVLDMDYFSDDGDPILRLRTAQTQEQLQTRIFYSELQIDMETGVGLATGQGSAPLLMMRYSNDGGHTWSNERTATVGAVGEYGARCRFMRLGAGRNRVWEISMTDPVKFCVLGAVANAQAGES
jgi:hypothetical protein